MLKNGYTKKIVPAIPRLLNDEWREFTSGITNQERDKIIEWINEKFDEVANRRERVQPSGWLGSGFDWLKTPLMPIYRECDNILLNATNEEKEEKSGQIFGLFISLTLADYNPREWFFVKNKKYQARGIPIRSRIYFLRGT